MSEESRDTSFDHCLAHACQAANSACCCKGRIFLPDNETEAIRGWLKARPEVEQANFERCLDDDHDGFALLDQENRCQFLDDRNLCRLHNEGVKPSECFWWPMHVYVNRQDQLEVRVSETCCEAFNCLNGGQSNEGAELQVEKLAARVREIGPDVVRRFRKAYQGSYENRPVRVLEE